MIDPRDALLRESAELHRATVALFATLPEHYRAAHLAIRARDLAGRMERALPKPEVPNA